MKFLVTESQFKSIISKIGTDLEFYLLNEGQNEDRALQILKTKISDPEEVEEIFNFLKKIDKSKNNKLMPAIASFYVNAKNINEYSQIVNTFKELFTKKTIPEITLTKDGDISVLGDVYKKDDFESFKEFIDHYYYEKDSKEDEEMVKLYDVNANKIFENDNFEVYYAASEKVCIKLFGKDYQDRLYIERGYCIGWGSPESPREYYSNYRDPGGTYKRTFYVVVDKNLYKKYVETGEDNSSLINVVGVKEDFNETKKYFVWDKNNPPDGDAVQGYPSVNDYMKHLEDGGVNLGIFKPMPYKTKSDQAIKRITSNPNNDNLFLALSPQQKDSYVSTYAKTLTPFQMKFMLTKMPKSSLDAFLNNYTVIGDLSSDSFNLLNQNLQKTFLRSKLKQLTSGSELFNIDQFFNYVTNDVNKNYVIDFIQKSFADEVNLNRDKEKSMKILGLLSPKIFFETLKGQTSIKINSENFKLSELPENLGEYIVDATHLEIENLNRVVTIPESIGMAKNLIHLEIKKCDLLELLPDSIGELNQIDFLGLQENKNLKRIPNTISNLTNLTHLSLHGDSSLTKLPDNMQNLENLIVLNIEGTPLEKLPLNELKEMMLLTHVTYDETTLENLTDEEKEFLNNL